MTLRCIVAALAFAASAAPAVADIRIGVILSLTGPAASLGIRRTTRWRRGRRKVAGQKLVVMVLDDASDPTAAAVAARKLTQEEHVDVLIGPSVSLVESAAPKALLPLRPGSAEFRKALRDAIEAGRELVLTHGVHSLSATDDNGADHRSQVFRQPGHLLFAPQPRDLPAHRRRRRGARRRPRVGQRAFLPPQRRGAAFPMPHDDLQTFPPMVNLQQYPVEDILVRAIEAHAGRVDLRWQSRVNALRPRGGDAEPGVELDVDSADGRYTLVADWVAACDGGRSTVRDALGARIESTAHEGRYVVADIRLQRDLPTERLAWFDPTSNPGSTILMHRPPDDIWRIDYQIRDGEDAADAVRPENVLPRIEAHLAMMGIVAPWQLVWTTLYKANALTLARYREGRVLLLGDAAHLVPNFGVPGANSTIDDANKEAWKIALLARRLADASLLDSYSSECVQAAPDNLAHGRKSTEFMAPPNFAFEAMRLAVLTLSPSTRGRPCRRLQHRVDQAAGRVRSADRRGSGGALRLHRPQRGVVARPAAGARRDRRCVPAPWRHHTAIFAIRPDGHVLGRWAPASRAACIEAEAAILYCLAPAASSVGPTPSSTTSTRRCATRSRPRRRAAGSRG